MSFLDKDGLEHLVAQMKSIFYRKPDSGIPKSDLSSSVQQVLPAKYMTCGQVKLKYASTSQSITFEILGMSSVDAVFFTECLDSVNIRVSTTSSTNPKPAQTVTSNGVKVTAVVPAVSGASSTATDRYTTYIAIGTKK